jgi:hypothetical protein
MDEDVNQVVAKNIVLVDVIVQPETEVRYRAIFHGAFKSCPRNLSGGKLGKTNVGIILNVRPIIKDERASQSM